ncbi:hypothetical protein EDC01DRAFT_499621 [Geopyxis carbonaria]|nr:hypothetical protein EDC01DRAFT_499621 [Geopyxis carbonaria]
MTTEVASAPPPPTIEAEKTFSPSHIALSATPTPSKKSSKTSTSISASAADASSGSDDAPASPKSDLPKIIVKKEPTSPDPPSRHRPPKLHLNNNDTEDPSGTPVPRTAGGNLATMRDVGMACLSPGFATQDPTMREQLQRSLSVRDHQRSIIEARLQRHPPKTAGGHKDSSESQSRGSGSHTPKRRPPPGLSIVPPPHRAFANERVVQSAPLNQSFTGRHQHHHGSQNPHQHQQQTQVNRLPPIADVFASERLESGRPSRLAAEPSSSRQAYYPSSSRPSQPSPNNSAFTRSREHRSAEEALAHMSGGREDLLPRIIHYGGHQPPTPPSPPQQQSHTPSKLGVNGAYEPLHSAKRRRTRDEYERESDSYPGARESPEIKRQKKEEFLSLCARAWELLHS